MKFAYATLLGAAIIVVLASGYSSVGAADSSGSCSPGTPSCTATAQSAVAIQIDGIAIPGITEVLGPASGVEYKDPEDMTTRYRPGNNKSGRIKITREWSNDTTFIDWYQASPGQGKADRKTITVTILADNGTAASYLVLTGATPTGWEINFPSFKSLGSAHATESLSLVYENFDYKK